MAKAEPATQSRVKFTSGVVEKFRCPHDKKEAFLWDSESKFLGLKASSGGSRKYIFQSRLKTGLSIRLTIGDLKVWTLEDARIEARRLQTLVDSGIDPRIDKAERLAETVEKQAKLKRTKQPAIEIWNGYIAARKAKWSDKHLADHFKVSKTGGEIRTRGRRPGEPVTTLPGILLPLLNCPLEEITSDTVKAWLSVEALKRPTHARLAFGLLRAFLNWCAESKGYGPIVHTDACTTRISKSELPKKAAKDDCLQREQLPAWFCSVQKISTPTVRAYLQIALLTGARREELSSLEWVNVDFQWQSLTIKDKVEGSRTIPLTPYVAHLLRDLKRLNDTPPAQYRILNGKKIENDLTNWKPSPWVFSSPTAADGKLQEPRKGHNRALEDAGLPALSIHGLRRSFGTLAEWVECPAGISAQIMGHKPSATAEKHYRVRPLDLLRMWHSKIEGWLLEQAGIELPNKEGKPALKVVA